MTTSICPLDNERMRYYLSARDYLYQTSNKIYQVFKCTRCSLEKIHPLPSKKEISSFYPINYYSYHVQKVKNQDFFLKLREKIVDISYNKKSKKDIWYLLALIFKNLLPGLPLNYLGNRRFLDVGCGDGYSLDLLSKYHWKTFGFELGEPFKKGSIYYGPSLLGVDFKKTTFDYIRVWHLLEHVPNPASYIKKLASLLTQKGHLTIGVPNSASLYAKLFGKYWYNRDIPRHVINYNPYTLALLCNKYNLKIISVKYNSFGGLLDSLLRLLDIKYRIKINLFNKIKFFLVILFYPIDLVCNLLKIGDLFFFDIIKDNKYHFVKREQINP